MKDEKCLAEDIGDECRCSSCIDKLVAMAELWEEYSSDPTYEPEAADE